MSTETHGTAETTSSRPVSGALGRPVATSSRVDDLTDRLVTAIAIGEYLPGSRLPAERDLAASLGAGRMTVRAALARLVERGLLETQRGRGGGSFVTAQWPVSSADAVQRTLTARWEALQETCDAISRLHGTLARAAAENRTADDIDALGDRLAAFRDAESGLAKQEADSLLHVSIIQAARNTILRDVLFELESRISMTAPAHLWGEPTGMAAMERRALGEHEALVDAITRGSADEAAGIAREHVKIDFELLEAALTRSRD
ncbi:FadR/GntR family transcriptional regulator [Frondihabitans peucedani]|uniref:GntR family transcriptional regulator n=1 Tax=Frondihabitans peucedani TaxID=598626 RepID=A0ABP8E276_9MICO